MSEEEAKKEGKTLVNHSKIIKELKFEFTPIDKSLIEMAEALIKLNIVQAKPWEKFVEEFTDSRRRE